MSQTRDGIWYDKPDEIAQAEPAHIDNAPAEQAPGDAKDTAAPPPAREHLPSDDIELTTDGRTPKREMPPVGIFVAISLAALAMGLGVLSYLRSVSRERGPRRARSDS